MWRSSSLAQNCLGCMSATMQPVGRRTPFSSWLKSVSGVFCGQRLRPPVSESPQRAHHRGYSLGDAPPHLDGGRSVCLVRASAIGWSAAAACSSLAAAGGVPWLGLGLVALVRSAGFVSRRADALPGRAVPVPFAPAAPARVSAAAQPAVQWAYLNRQRNGPTPQQQFHPHPMNRLAVAGGRFNAIFRVTVCLCECGRRSRAGVCAL